MIFIFHFKIVFYIYIIVKVNLNLKAGVKILDELCGKRQVPPSPLLHLGDQGDHPPLPSIHLILTNLD